MTNRRIDNPLASRTYQDIAAADLSMLVSPLTPPDTCSIKTLLQTMAKKGASRSRNPRTILPYESSSNAASSTENAPPPYSVAAADLETMKRSQNCRVIAVMGATGSGKSTLISKLSAKEIKIGHSLQSCGYSQTETNLELIACLYRHGGN